MRRSTQQWISSVLASDGVQEVLPEVLGDAPLDGFEEEAVPLPEGDDGVAGSGLGGDVWRGLHGHHGFIFLSNKVFPPPHHDQKK